MKTILLIRHSEPIKDRTMPTAELPLSERGYRKAQELFSLKTFHSVQAVYTSPYRRATSTAEKLRVHFYMDERLRERELGNPNTLNEAFWSRQYEDYNYYPPPRSLHDDICIHFRAVAIHFGHFMARFRHS